MTALNKIEGIGKAYAEKLNQAGIRSIEALLEAGGSSKGRKDLVEKTGITDNLILNWVNRSDLFRVPRIGEQYSDLLEKAGVDTVVELSKRNPENLLAKMIEVNKEKNLVNRLPSLKMIESWIKAAKELPRKVQY
jgi:predicted flap endonuclease-1-like 5' DNA nuclease